MLEDAGTGDMHMYAQKAMYARKWVAYDLLVEGAKVKDWYMATSLSSWAESPRAPATPTTNEEDNNNDNAFDSITDMVG